MARKFCSDCLTFHDGRCSPGALAKAGKGKSGATKTGRAKAREPRSDAAEASEPAAAPSPVAGESIGPTITKTELIDALTVQLPKAEADKFRAIAEKMEANAKANRERVAAHKLGISVAEYRKRLTQSPAPGGNPDKQGD